MFNRPKGSIGQEYTNLTDLQAAKLKNNTVVILIDNLFTQEFSVDSADLGNGLLLASGNYANIKPKVNSVPTLTALISSTNLTVGMRFKVDERTTGNGGGAVWDVVLASTVTISPGAPDIGNVVASTGDATLALVLRNEGTYDVQQWGAKINTDDSSYSDALQYIVDISGNPADTSNPNTTKVTIGQGPFYITKPIYINALDGLEIEHSGLFNTTIKVSSSFAASVPPSFPSDGLDYTGNAYFVFARLRNTGKTGAFIVPGQAAGAGAAWYYKITGFYFDAEGSGIEKNIDIVRAPEIANLWMQDVIGHKIRYINNTDDNLGNYSSTYDRVQTWYSTGGIKANRGTSLLVNQCALVHSDEGWNTRTNYSTYNSTTIDLCEGVGGNYAWDLGGIGVTMNSCGCEYPKGGIFRALTRGTEIVINGGFFLGGAKQADPNFTGQASEVDFNVAVGEMILVDGAKVTNNRAVFRNVTEAVPSTVVHLNATVKNGGRLTNIGNTGEDFNEYVQPNEFIATGSGVGGNKDLSRIDWVGETAQFELFTTSDETLARNGTPQVTFSNLTLEHDLGPSYFQTNYGVTPRTGTPITEYTIPMAGIYEFTFSGFIDNVDPGDYIYFAVTGKTNRILTLSDFPDDVNIGTNFSLSDRFMLNPGDTVKIFYRSFSTTVDPVIKSGARWYGGIV